MLEISIVWSVNYLIKILQIEIELIRKRFSIYGFFNIFSLMFVFFLILIGGKYLLFHTGNYFNLALLVSLVILLAGLTVVTPDYKKYLQKVSILNTYFPRVGINKVKDYYKYRKFVLSCLIILYCLIPLKFPLEDIKYFFAIIIFLLFCMLINTICSIFLSKTIAESVHVFIRILYSIILALYSRHMLLIDIENMILSFDVVILGFNSFILLILNFFILSKK